MKNRYIVDDDNQCVYIELNHKILGKCYTIIDIDDFDKVSNIPTTWYLCTKNGRKESVKTKIQKNRQRKLILLHRLIMNTPKDKVVDHMNGDILDNRKYNLRNVYPHENATNLSGYSNNKTGYRNIYFENNYYRVRINNESFGMFKVLEDAIKVRDKMIPNIFPLRKR